MRDNENDDDELREVREKAAFDQGSATLADLLPPLCRRMCDGFQNAGFSPVDAMSLTKAYLFATLGGRLEK